MAKIKVVSDRPLIDGMAVTFRAPCECSAVDGLTVSYLGADKNFTFRDAHGNNLTGLGNLFSEGVLVKAVLDVTNGGAYILNADTNKYHEEKFETTLRMVKLWENASPTSSFAAQTISLDLSTYNEVQITMCTGSNAGLVGTYRFKVGSGTQMTYGAGPYMGRRNFKVTTSGVTAEGGSKYEDSWADSNAYQKPLAIYGLKGVR